MQVDLKIRKVRVSLKIENLQKEEASLVEKFHELKEKNDKIQIKPKELVEETSSSSFLKSLYTSFKACFPKNKKAKVQDDLKTYQNQLTDVKRMLESLKTESDDIEDNLQNIYKIKTRCFLILTFIFFQYLLHFINLQEYLF